MTLGLQIVYSYPFLSVYPQEYLKGSYNFSRVYVHGHNFFWRFVPPFICRLPVFNFTLLLFQVGLLIFYLFGKWLKIKDCFKQLGVWPIRIFPNFAEQDTYHVAEVFFICNFIGMVCARGIFFQYVMWFWYSIPFVLWSGPMKFQTYSVKQLLYIVCFLDFVFTLGAHGGSRYPGVILAQVIIIWVMYKNFMAVKVHKDSGYNVVSKEEASFSV